MSDEEQEEQDDLVDAVLDEFLERRRRGDLVEIQDYLTRYPHLSDQLEKLLPLVASLDQNATPPSNQQTTLPPGTQLGNYELIGVIGHGGMGVVYEARQKSLDRNVALKVLQDRLVRDPKAKSRFLREAKLASSLQHPHIVPIYEPGESQGRLYYTMQRIDGQPLSLIVQQWRLKYVTRPHQRPKSHWQQIAQWIHDAADAVALAHRHGILHRDLKPSNFLVDGGNQIFLCDFGLAKNMASEPLDTTQDLPGTLRYTSPEGLYGQYTPQSDVYGLGITLHELLGMFPKYTAQNQASLYQSIIHQEGVQLRQIDAQIPKDLITISEKATAFSLKRRYLSATDLRDDLRRYLDHQPILARTGGIVDQSERWFRNNQSLAYLLASTMAFHIGMISLTSYFAIDSRKKEQQTRQALSQATAANIDQKISLASQVAMLGRSDSRGQAESILRTAFDSLKKQPNPPTEARPDIQRVITQVLSLADLGVLPERLAPKGNSPVTTACDPHYRRILFSDKSGNTELYSLPDWKRILTFPKTKNTLLVSISPDGRFATIGFDKDEEPRQIACAIECWDIEAQPPQRQFRLENLAGNFGCWSHASDRLYCVDYDGSILGLDPRTGQRQLVLPPTGPLREVRVYPHPREPIIAVASYYYHEIHFRDLRTGQTLAYHYPGSISGLSWHPSGDSFSICPGDRDSKIWIVEWPSGRLKHQMDAHSGGAEPSFSPDGKWLAVTYWGGLVEAIDCTTWDRMQRRWQWQLQCIAWSHDSRTLGITRLNDQFHRLEVVPPEGILQGFDEGKVLWDVNFPVLLTQPSAVLAKAASPGSDLMGLGLGEGEGILSIVNGKNIPTLVAADDSSRLYAIDISTGIQKTYEARLDEPRTLRLRLLKADPLPHPALAPSASADGRFLFDKPSPNQLVWWSTADPGQSDSLAIDEVSYLYPSGTGRWVAVGDEKYRLHSLVDRTNKSIAYRFDESDARATFSRDDRLMFVSPSNRILETQNWTVLADLSDGVCSAAAFTPDSAFLVRGEEDSHDLLFYSLKEGRDLLRINVTPLTPRHLQFTNDGRKLILALGSLAIQRLQVFDFQQMAIASQRLFPDIPYIPEPMRKSLASPIDAQTRQQPRLQRITIEDTTEEDDARKEPIDGNPAAPPQRFTQFGQFPELDFESVWSDMFEEVRSQCIEPDRRAIEAWESDPTKDLGTIQLNQVAQGLANEQRYEEAIAVCDRSLVKTDPNFNASMTKAYALWKLQRTTEAIELLQEMGLQIKEFALADYYKSAMEVILRRSTDPSVDSQQFMRATAPHTKQHPTYRLFLLLEDSMLDPQVCNLNDLHLALAEELIQQNDQIPDHWFVLAKARARKDDIQGAKQALKQFIQLKQHARRELISP
jgi:serine/threonine protein kinase/dipeptidyl aminopeptidase/acylaminoacyl peptidase